MEFCRNTDLKENAAVLFNPCYDSHLDNTQKLLFKTIYNSLLYLSISQGLVFITVLPK